jgi:hypothetical protein
MYLLYLSNCVGTVLTFDYKQNKALDTNYRIPDTIAPTTKIFRDVTPAMISPTLACVFYGLPGIPGKDESRRTGMRILTAVLCLSDLRKPFKH